MRFVGVAMQAFGIGEDGVGEVVVLIDEEIHFLSGTFALMIEEIELVDGPIFFIQFFFDTFGQEVGIYYTEVVETDVALVIPEICR